MRGKFKSSLLFISAGIILAIGSWVLWTQLIVLRSQGNMTGARHKATSSSLLFLASVCAFLIPVLIQSYADKTLSGGGITAGAQRDDGYVARASLTDRLILLCLGTSLTFISVWISFGHTINLLTISLCALSMVVDGLAYRTCMMYVTFTHDVISVHLFPVHKYSERYSSIVRVDESIREIRVAFLSGRKLRLWNGLGERCSILEALGRSRNSSLQE
jgi:hypothetical protein